MDLMGFRPGFGRRRRSLAASKSKPIAATPLGHADAEIDDAVDLER